MDLGTWPLVSQDNVAATWLNFVSASSTRPDAKQVDWQDNIFIPAYTSAVSAAILLYVLFRQSKRFFSCSRRSDSATGSSHETVFARAKGHIWGHGGPLIFAFEAARLIGCVVLSFFSFALFLRESSTTEEGIYVYGPKSATAISLCVTFAYYSCLALGIIVLPTGFPRSVLKANLDILLVVAGIVFTVRDLAPLCTYHGRPADNADGSLLWGFITDLVFTAFILPLLQPRQYVPVDPSDPKPATPEQKASLLSILLFTWLDRLVWRANRVDHLPLAELPPLADYDHTSILTRAAFPNIDPLYQGPGKPRRRHIFWGLLRTYRTPYILIACAIFFQAASTLLSPYALKHLLNYIQTEGVGAEVKPWVWIILLFVAPFITSILAQQYYSLYTRVSVHLEAVLTQMILEHSLRIRLVAETDNETKQPTTPTPVTIEGVVDNVAEEDASTISSTTAVEAPDATESSSKSKSLVGRMNNLISSDLKTIITAGEFTQPLFLGPLLISGSIGFLYNILGWSAFVGLAGMIIQLPIPIWFSKLLQATTKNVTKKSDARVDAVTETMGVVRMIKLFGWESKMIAQLDEKREEELLWLWKSRIYSMCVLTLNFILPAVTMVLTFASYAVILKRPFDAATVFSAVAAFTILRHQVHRTFALVPSVIKGKVSLDRIDDFLNNTELLDQYTSEQQPTAASAPSKDIGFRAAKFSWSAEPDSGALTPSKCRFRLHIEDELLFKKGMINLIVGKTGSGKSSMLLALLGEMHFLPYEPNSWFNLPRDGGIAYAAQESWVLNDTIKGNIVFGAPFDEERYKKVIYQCALVRDLSLFAAGDKTEVGEKGLTLSGGQKARITLARAIYSSAEILILDDVLAALDVHTSKWIVDKCLLGDLVKGRTLILVTHNVSLAGPHADFVVSLTNDGRVHSQGSFAEVLAQDDKLQEELVQDEEQVASAEQAVDEENAESKGTDGKLIVEEESGIGHLNWQSLKMYFRAFGGRYPTLFWIAFWSATFFECIVEIGQPWILGQWADEYENLPPEQVDVAYYLGLYIFSVLLMLVVWMAAQLGLALGSLTSSKILHKRLIENVLSSTLRWLDKTPTSRVITRCTQDISAIDNMIPDVLSGLFEATVILIVRFIAVMYVIPVFGPMGFAVLIIGLGVGHLYVRAQLSVKREQDKAKAPVMGHFQSTIEGIISVRAYGAQAAFKLKSMQTIDNYSRAALINWDLNRWIAIRVDVLGNSFASALAAYFVYGNTGIGAGNSGFSLNLAVGFGMLVLWWVRSANTFEVQGNSIERLYQYMVIEQEPKATREGVPPAYWPSSGELRVEKLCARYSQDGPRVLHDLTFEVKSGERVGIVGRTGSGKSSLTLSLLRCILTEGDVYYDGLKTSSINLDALRSHITIIPQIPELLSGSLRKNLDPFDQYDDATLNNALRSAGLFSLQSEDNESRMTLDSAISRGGGNLSVGQRQIIALARAIVRESKLLILDEATSAIDYKTDAIIQESLRTELKKDVTVLTVAHRLHSIMDSNKIMVLDAGKIVEFDEPKELLKNPNGFLRSLVDESGERDALYAAADAMP